MSWIAPKLSKKVQILIPSQEPNASGGFNFGFSSGEAFGSNSFDNLQSLVSVWMGLAPVGWKGSGLKYIRGKQVSETVSHEFIVRYLAVANLGKQLSNAFSIAFKVMADLGMLKPNYYLFLQKNDSVVEGRLFRIDSIINVHEADEYLSIEHGYRKRI